MYARLLGATLAVAISAYPVQAMKMKPENANNALATCVASLLLIGLPLGCAKARLSNASAKGKAQVTIHKPEGGTCANGNTYRIMRVSNPRSVCKNSFKHGSAVPACANISGRNGNAHTIIIVNKAGAHLAHEIRHACDRDWQH